MDAQQTNRIFWVGTTAAALWLTYRALKKIAPPTVAPVTSVPVVEIPQSDAVPVVAEDHSTSWIMDLGEGSIGAVTWQQSRDLTDANLWVESLSQSQKDWVNMAFYVSEFNEQWGPLYDTYVNRAQLVLTDPSITLAAFVQRIVSQIRDRLGG